MTGPTETRPGANITSSENPLHIDRLPTLRQLTKEDYPVVQGIVSTAYKELAEPRFRHNLDTYVEQVLLPIEKYLSNGADDAYFCVAQAHIVGNPEDMQRVVGVFGFTNYIQEDVLAFAQQNFAPVPGLEEAVVNNRVVEFRALYKDLRLKPLKGLPTVNIGNTLMTHIENEGSLRGNTHALFFSNLAWERAQRHYDERGYVKLGVMDNRFPAGFAYAVDLRQRAIINGQSISH